MGRLLHRAKSLRMLGQYKTRCRLVPTIGILSVVGISLECDGSPSLFLYNDNFGGTDAVAVTKRRRAVALQGMFCCPDGPFWLLFARFLSAGEFFGILGGDCMQSQLTIINPTVTQVTASSIFSRFVGWIARIFGCWHREMSRPFSHHGHAYRTCLNCGAQRRFNLNNWEMQGSYYYNRPSTRQLQVLSGFQSIRKAA